MHGGHRAGVRGHLDPTTEDILDTGHRVQWDGVGQGALARSHVATFDSEVPAVRPECGMAALVDAPHRQSTSELLVGSWETGHLAGSTTAVIAYDSTNYRDALSETPIRQRGTLSYSLLIRRNR